MKQIRRWLCGMLGLTLMLSGRVDAATEESVWDRLGVGVHGFTDVRAGVRAQSDEYQDDLSLGEVRLQLDVNRNGDYTTLQLRADLIYDAVVGEESPDLESGKGFIDLREANIQTTPLDIMDVKLGRQILTWGTGDLLFINDLFPKDWQSFFSGRDVEYLKAPSDAVFASLYPAFANIDLVYMPRMDADRFISGERYSYWNPMLGRRAGEDALVMVDERHDWFADDELAMRVYRNVGGYELAAYGYIGYWKSPVGYDPMARLATHPRLSVYGASARGTLGKGIANVEAGYYDSRDDDGGDDPLTPNDEARLLVGYDRELVRNLNLGLQYYLEFMEDYGDYLATLPEGAMPRDEDRHVLTVRVTQRLLNQDLTLSLFAYYSPSDADAYLRPAVEYQASDHWRLQAGGNWFVGRKPYTFFGQFEDNSNVYAGARYSF